MPADQLTHARLRDLERIVTEQAEQLALFLVFDRPDRVEERPGLSRAYFAQRCASDAQLNGMIAAFREVGVYVQLFDGEQPLIEALSDGSLAAIERPLKVVYNGIEGGIAWDGFAPGRKALIPAVVDSFGLIWTNSNAYGCALGRHKFHYFTLLSSLGIRTPRTWHYRPGRGWAGERRPDLGTRVIVKSTYESWSVGVTEDSIFEVEADAESRVAEIADRLGQAATVQEFISGAEVGVSLVSMPEVVPLPLMETVLAKAPGDPDAFTTIDDNLRHAAISHRRYAGSPATVNDLGDQALKAFDLLELDCFARIDFRVDAEGLPWVTDVGVSPGISKEDSAFHAAAELGLDHPSFLRAVVGATLASRAELASSRARTRSLGA
jgi:D-alanine-D-alanine ligase